MNVKDFSVTHFQLKLLALFGMLLDHSMKLFQQPLLYGLQKVCGTIGSHVLYYGVLSLGRMAMLIFAFQIAEGLRHTHHTAQYLLRLCLLAVVSEIPFQCVHHLIVGTPIQMTFALTNVVGTLLLGAVACIGYAYALAYNRQTYAPWIVVVLALLAQMLGMDYGWFGVVYIFFCCYGSRKQQILVTVIFYGIQMLFLFVGAYGMTWLSLYIVGMNLLIACATLWLLGKYHGVMGKRLPKWIGYGFYPVHLALLAVCGVLWL